MRNHVPTRQSLVEGLLRDIEAVPDHPVTRVVTGGALVAVCARRVGLCANLAGMGPTGGLDPDCDPEALIGVGAGDAARDFLSRPNSPLRAALGLACVNALLAPPDGLVDRKAQDLLLERGRGRHAAVVGHFPFVEGMGREFASFTVLEKNPRPGDLPAAMAPEVLGRAEVAAVTASALANGSLAEILGLLPKTAFVMLLGPSAPFAPSLFEAGVDVLAGSDITDPEAALAAIAQGAPFKGLPGTRHPLWEKNASGPKLAVDVRAVSP